MSYAYAYQNLQPAADADFIDPDREAITADYDEGAVIPVTLHDGSRIMLKKTEKDFDPRDRGRAFDYIMRHQEDGQIVTGLLYIDETRPDMHDANKTIATPLTELPYGDLCPGADALADLQARYR